MKGALFILLTTVLSVLAEQKFAVEPEDVSAVVGSHVTLPCKVISKHGMLQWTKDDFGLGTHRNLSAFERYSMIGNDEDGDFSLKIESVNLDDDAKFQCQVSPSEGKLQAFLGSLIFGESSSLLWWCGTSLVVIGVVLMTTDQSADHTSKVK
ncbi:Irregular chiasm C-roughest protein [Pseudolycoriella hygida]|uniref:Irregular chiasm C-roughest protein n=1 Tax=Pseudolycoriella hygida TaxID=35572 RepID=A0A9Q0N8T4_9DIPT|nr:Irregular chiasm C-roughest protein [Pseudolycoriella hygida]